jgi:hypothetical protein
LFSLNNRIHYLFNSLLIPFLKFIIFYEIEFFMFGIYVQKWLQIDGGEAVVNRGQELNSPENFHFCLSDTNKVKVQCLLILCYAVPVQQPLCPST